MSEIRRKEKMECPAPQLLHRPRSMSRAEGGSAAENHLGNLYALNSRFIWQMIKPSFLFRFPLLICFPKTKRLVRWVINSDPFSSDPLKQRPAVSLADHTPPCTTPVPGRTAITPKPLQATLKRNAGKTKFISTRGDQKALYCRHSTTLLTGWYPNSYQRSLKISAILFINQYSKKIFQSWKKLAPPIFNVFCQGKNIHTYFSRL